MISRLCFIFALLALGCSNPYERDNPMDPAIVHKITFNANGATGTAPAAISGSYGDAVTLPDGSGLVKSGYVFGGWTDPATGNNYSVGSSYTIKGGVAMDVWWRPLRTITFDGNGGTGYCPPITVASDSLVRIPYLYMSRPGYIFDDWYANSSGTGTEYKENFSYIISSDITLYAKWIAAYIVTYDPNGATIGVSSIENVATGETTVLRSHSSWEKTGFVFAGWNTDTSGTGTNYNVGSSFTPTGNITLYAKWLPARTVTFNSNGATGTPPEAMTTGLGMEIQLPARGNLEKTGSSFIGWSANNSGAGTSYHAGSSYTVADNISLYATWVSCSNYNSQTHICDERDQQIYRITTIGNQLWMAENLKYNASGSGCDANCEIYGQLYSWATAMGLASSCNSSNTCSTYGADICPEGWHLPSRGAWNELITFVGGASVAGKKLKATWSWNNNGNGTDEYGFSALPGGGTYMSGGASIGSQGYWWSSNQSNSNANAYNIAVRLSIGSGSDNAEVYEDYKRYTSSVRCVKN